MKRMKRNPKKFETLGLARQDDLTFSDPDSSHRFLQGLEHEFHSAITSPTTLHGLRTQTMFEYVAASLGKCAIIKAEDAGEIYFDTDGFELPDYRILLHSGQEMFIEVKNFNQKNGFEPYVIKKIYLDGLLRYASLFKKELKFAIYWSRWKIWTLVSPALLEAEGSKYTLPIVEALKHNEMQLLGDINIGTTPPLVLRLVADPTKPRTVEPDGTVNFTIGSVELHCNGTYITDSFEKSLAFHYMLYGRWPVDEAEAEITEDQLVAIRYSAAPEEPHPGQEFEFLGSMSEMVSKHFDALTLTNQGIVDRLSPNTETIELAIRIPDDYKGKALPLWRLSQQPTKP